MLQEFVAQRARVALIGEFEDTAQLQLVECFEDDHAAVGAGQRAAIEYDCRHAIRRHRTPFWRVRRPAPPATWQAAKETHAPVAAGLFRRLILGDSGTMLRHCSLVVSSIRRKIPSGFVVRGFSSNLLRTTDPS